MAMLGKKPFVSVIIPSKNRPDLVHRAIDSVLGQTFQSFEVIIVDDGSDMPLYPMLAEKFGNSISCFRHEHSLGAPAARNFGASHAKGKFVAFLDDDDIWLPEKLEKQMAAFSCLSEDFGVVYCGFDFIANGTVVERKNTYHTTYDLHELALKMCPVGSPTPIIRKNVFEAVGGFDVSLLACQDWDLWIRLTRVCRFYPIKQSLARYRVHGDQISTDVLRKIEARKMIVEKYYQEMSEYPKILSSHYQRIGSLCSLAGRKNEAKYYFWRSINMNKANWGSWVHLILQFGGKKIEKYLIEKFGITKVGEARILN